MPRYRYQCLDCFSELVVLHLFNERPELVCDGCGQRGTLQRGLTIPHIPRKPTEAASAVGELTEEFIEENKEILEQQKQEARDKEYE